MFTSDPRRVDDLLAQFPGPVQLPLGRIRLVLGLLFTVALCVLTTSSALRSAAWSFGAFIGWTATAILLTYIVAGALSLPRGAGNLTLRADGFETSGRLRIFVAWRHVSDFTVKRVMLTQFIVYTIDNGTTPQPYKALLTGHYGMRPDDFARLMNEWRAKATTGLDQDAPR